MTTHKVAAQDAGHYATVNGIRMYYEIHGSGEPLVLLHGGGSTIQTNFSKVIPLFAQHHKVIAVELEAHGHTGRRPGPTSFIQDADDVAALLQQLHIRKSDILGFSNGGMTCIEIATRHPELVNRLILLSAPYNCSGMPEELWKSLPTATIDMMPKPYQEAFLHDNPGDTAGLRAMFEKDRNRMVAFKGWDDAVIKNIQAPTLVAVGDQDAVLAEHAVAMYRLLPKGRLMILPGRHGECIGEVLFQTDPKVYQATVALFEDFLQTPLTTR
ncbi:alpha/beta fold hydrolase [Chitinophaga vietnamensis]|uniref:alpha/beta fold hydrolase n=1 Tax=Chitinophaga vietnamensis TaxID=2593957 RepID=UPI0013756405|nr:alpha/beta hydrolase [Chitinophaga vietnamensis]